nr:MAG TPA: hypothetical protein [Bacteriophage sp.]DAW14308.1 MAG TPA: hypothetical protein [Caudoviricetes sp.]
MLCSILRFVSWLLNRIIASVQNHGSYWAANNTNQ